MRYQDKEVRHRTLTEILRARRMIQLELGTAPRTRSYAVHKRGLHE